MSVVETSGFRRLPISEMELRIAAFEARLNASMRSTPDSKQWVRDALRRKGAGRCPVRMKRLSLDIILKYGDSLAGLFDSYPDDVVAVIPYDITLGYQPPDKSPRINPVEAMTRGMEWVDEWGTRWGHAFGGVGATPVDYPLKDWSMLDAYLREEMPSANTPGRMDDAERVLAMHKPSKYCFGIVHLALFERLHSLRGMENVFTDFYLCEPEVHRLLDALEIYLLQMVHRWADLGADAVFMTDDWGSQNGLLISPDLWRALFKPYYKRVFEEIHALGMDAIFHSCGNVTAIVGDLIDIGLDVLDPVQPGAMNIEHLAREYGGSLAFSGAVDIQDLLVRESPERIKEELRRIVDTIGKPFGGALLLGPANVMTPDIPFENLVALFEAAHNYE